MLKACSTPAKPCLSRYSWSNEEVGLNDIGEVTSIVTCFTAPVGECWARLEEGNKVSPSFQVTPLSLLGQVCHPRAHGAQEKRFSR